MINEISKEEYHEAWENGEKRYLDVKRVFHKIYHKYNGKFYVSLFIMKEWFIKCDDEDEIVNVNGEARDSLQEFITIHNRKQIIESL
jgi:hypothetical protein